MRIIFWKKCLYRDLLLRLHVQLGQRVWQVSEVVACQLQTLEWHQHAQMTYVIGIQAVERQVKSLLK